MNAPFDTTQLQSTLRKMGNSTGMILPKAILDQLGLTLGTKVELRVENGEVIARPAKRRVREGWAEAAKRVGSDPLSEEDLAWLDMPNDFDKDWVW